MIHSAEITTPRCSPVPSSCPYGSAHPDHLLARLANIPTNTTQKSLEQMATIPRQIDCHGAAYGGTDIALPMYLLSLQREATCSIMSGTFCPRSFIVSSRLMSLDKVNPQDRLPMLQSYRFTMIPGLFRARCSSHTRQPRLHRCGDCRQRQQHQMSSMPEIRKNHADYAIL
ncbi:uncharacterized protein PgNI_11926, partial [Pyricularia grisea]|uniref:Uncharacterized protein n=1 Tax=Pyricularia grisea TaxID=148305 RepID=A0A6P8AQY4_PYRGI